ncbi:hypothetical protein C8R48DRAFT_773553 [Suillus tomentosus]|nr:hypothetical protein C8R48DRAFT_773553 [Suillus tomentosus]
MPKVPPQRFIEVAFDSSTNVMSQYDPGRRQQFKHVDQHDQRSARGKLDSILFYTPTRPETSQLTPAPAHPPLIPPLPSFPPPQSQPRRSRRSRRSQLRPSRRPRPSPPSPSTPSSSSQPASDATSVEYDKFAWLVSQLSGAQDLACLEMWNRYINMSELDE